MAINNPFSKSEGAHGEPQLKDPEMILAYLEELARLHTHVKLWCREEDRVALSCQVLQVDEAGKRFLMRLQRALPSDLTPKRKLRLIFPLDDCRLLTQVRFLARAQYLEAWFTLPEAVRHAERRNGMRARFSNRDRATVTLLEGLQDQLAATGPLVDLSMEGLCLRVERAMIVQDNRPLTLHPSLFPQDKHYPIIRIDQLPFAPLVEGSGTLAHIRETKAGLLLGIRFDPLTEDSAQVLAQVMGRRLTRFAQSYPVRHRGGAPPADLPAAPPSQAVQVEVEVVDLSQARHDETQEERIIRQRIQRHKAKRIGLFLFDDLERAILASTMRRSGFEKLHEAKNYLEAVAHLKVFNLDLVIIAPQLGPRSVQEFLDRLRKQGLCQDIPLVLLAHALDVRVKLLAKAAQIETIHTFPLNTQSFIKSVKDLLKLQEEPAETN